MMLTDLADVLRSAGLKVVEVAGWKTRTNDGNRFVGVWGILCHWTATSPLAKGDYPSLNIVTNGRSDLPGMLSQLGLGRDGTWYVIGAGVAWHAGSVDRTASDNYHAVGIEAEYHPDQGAWPEVQQRSYERGCAALRAHYRVPLDQVRGHYEAAIPYGRKPDPSTLPGGMPGFRQRVAVAAAVNLEEDDTMNLLVKGLSRADCYIVSTTADGRWKRRIDGPELNFLTASGVKVHMHNQVDVDRIPDRSANAAATWNYGIPTTPGVAPAEFKDAHQVIATINQNTVPTDPVS